MVYYHLVKTFVLLGDVCLFDLVIPHYQEMELLDVGCFSLFSVHSVRLYNSQFHSSMESIESLNVEQRIMSLEGVVKSD